jgi:hypothetical protein
MAGRAIDILRSGRGVRRRCVASVVARRSVVSGQPSTKDRTRSGPSASSRRTTPATSGSPRLAASDDGFLHVGARWRSRGRPIASGASQSSSIPLTLRLRTVPGSARLPHAPSTSSPYWDACSFERSRSGAARVVCPTPGWAAVAGSHWRQPAAATVRMHLAACDHDDGQRGAWRSLVSGFHELRRSWQVAVDRDQIGWLQLRV